MITILPNQAIAFNIDTVDKCNTRFMLPALKGPMSPHHDGDRFMLQGISTIENTENRIDSTAWTFGTNYFISSGTVYCNGSSGVATTNTLGLRIGKLYKVTFQLNIIDVGTCTATQGVIFKINGEQLIPPGLHTGEGVHVPMNFSFFYIPTTTGSDVFEISTNNSTIQFYVYNYSVVQYSSPLLMAFDMNDNYIQSINTTLNCLTYYTNVLTNQPVRFDMSFTLDQLPEGCFYLALGDGQGDVVNGNFNDSSIWQSSADWTFAGISTELDGWAIYTQGSGNPLYQDIEIVPGSTYTINFATDSIHNMSMGFVITFSDSSQVTQSFTTNGNHTYTFTTPTGVTHHATIAFYPNSTGPVGPGWQVQLSSVSINFRNNSADLSRVPALIRSNTINVRSNWHQTLVFTATNNDGAFDFDYSGGLTHFIRLIAKMKYHDYSEEVEQYNFSDNSNILMTASHEKQFEIIVSDAAEFVHDCLSIMRIHDTFKINNAPCIRTGSYALRQRKSTELSSSAFSVKPVTGIGKNWALL